MPKYGKSKRTIDNLVGVHPDMIKVFDRALEILGETGGPDCFVNEGVRTPARQKKLYAQGRTVPGKKVTWTLVSNHFVNKKTGFGHAIDVYGYPYDNNQKPEVSKAIFKAMMAAAIELNIPIRGGMDWDRDGKFWEKGETDSPHFELWGY
jgi:peptidoglycan L-alanyl-D-glutamate endopeptidase CwlK